MSARTRIRLVVAGTLTAVLSLVAGPAGADNSPWGPAEIAPPLQPLDLPGVSISDAWAFEADGTINFTLTVDEPTQFGDNVDINFVHIDTEGDDFVHSAFNTSFGVGQTEAVLEVDLVQFDGVEPPEAFQLVFGDADGLEIEDGVGDGIVYDGSGPVINIADAEVVEGGHNDGRYLGFEVELSYPAPEGLQLRFATTAIDDEAEPDRDYEAVDEIMNWPVDATSATYQVPIIGDAVVERPTEVLVAWIADASFGSIHDDTAVGEIHDDDKAVLSVDDVTEVEGTGGVTEFHFTVSLNQPAPYDIDVDASLVEATATADVDYGDGGQIDLHFAPGEVAQEVVVKVAGDATPEADETFTFVLHDEQASVLGDAVGLGTIVDDDVVVDDGDPDDSDSDSGDPEGSLPVTGSSSTLVLTLVGGILVVLGLVLLVWRRLRTES